MLIIDSVKNIDSKKESVVTIGNFDGLHLGHKALIEKTINCAKENNFNSVVFTFSNHPQNYFNKNSLKRIILDEDKVEELKSLGVDIVVNIPFDDYMTKISAREFIENVLLKKLKVKKIIVGHDFNFARNKEGNTKFLKEVSSIYNFEVEVIDPIKVNNIRVSSSYIRNLLNLGKVDEISKYLGRNYSISGKVIHGKELGRTINFPTANMEINKEMIIPSVGIYATKVCVDQKIFIGATNIGYNPTVNGRSLSVETHILDFNEDIYDKSIKLEFLERIRDEKKFGSLEELKKQLNEDTTYIYKNYVCK